MYIFGKNMERINDAALIRFPLSQKIERSQTATLNDSINWNDIFSANFSLLLTPPLPIPHKSYPFIASQFSSSRQPTI